ncbi:hypothetical protein, partial [Salmonella enterica]|uniref:hypothetical protein n=1 Tax=Salmonella enterica TaxID=28901 RepID=UPI002891F0B8
MQSVKLYVLVNNTHAHILGEGLSKLPVEQAKGYVRKWLHNVTYIGKFKNGWWDINGKTELFHCGKGTYNISLRNLTAKRKNQGYISI